MVDGRRSLHRAAREDHPDWPVIPMASAVEQCAVRHLAVGQFAPTSPAAKGFGQLWTSIERKLAKQARQRG
jgi:chromosome partitioning protein